MKKKILIIGAMCSLFLVSCVTTQADKVEYLRKHYPGANVKMIPDDSYNFIIIKNDSIFMVKMDEMGINYQLFLTTRNFKNE